MKFSVLICTYNRHDLLEKAVRSIVEGTVEKPDELVVVNGGDEKADEVVRRFEKDSRGIEVRLIKTVNRNLATSRNIGIAACRGDIVAMTDDDAEVFPDWVTQMKRVHAEHPEAGAVGGPVLGTNTDSIVGKVADIVTFPVWDRPCAVRTLPGVNVSYKKEALDGLGAQDTVLFRGEDVDYNWRVQQKGFIIFFDPAIKVYHHHRPTWEALMRQHYMYGRAYVLVRRKWPEMYSVYPRQIRTLHDVLKGIHFFAALVYQPFLHLARLVSWKERILSFPGFFCVGVAWKWGMLHQMLLDAGAKEKSV